MKYETIVEKSSERITETYAVEGRVFEGEIAIHTLGWIAGTAGWDEHVVTVILKEGDTAFGTLAVAFPQVMRADVRHPQRMMEPGGRPRRLTGYAERIIGEAVWRFVRCKSEYEDDSFMLDGASFTIGLE